LETSSTIGENCFVRGGRGKGGGEKGRGKGTVAGKKNRRRGKQIRLVAHSVEEDVKKAERDKKRSSQREGEGGKLFEAKDRALFRELMGEGRGSKLALEEEGGGRVLTKKKEKGGARLVHKYRGKRRSYEKAVVGEKRIRGGKRHIKKGRGTAALRDRGRVHLTGAGLGPVGLRNFFVQHHEEKERKVQGEVVGKKKKKKKKQKIQKPHQPATRGKKRFWGVMLRARSRLYGRRVKEKKGKLGGFWLKGKQIGDG